MNTNPANLSDDSNSNVNPNANDGVKNQTLEDLLREIRENADRFNTEANQDNQESQADQDNQYNPSTTQDAPVQDNVGPAISDSNSVTQDAPVQDNVGQGTSDSSSLTQDTPAPKPWEKDLQEALQQNSYADDYRPPKAVDQPLKDSWSDMPLPEPSAIPEIPEPPSLGVLPQAQGDDYQKSQDGDYPKVQDSDHPKAQDGDYQRFSNPTNIDEYKYVGNNSPSDTPLADSSFSSVPSFSSNTPSTPSAPASSSPADKSEESLEAQNIFEMLGVSDGSNQQKEEFLDELQQIIWEDFLDNDAKLLLSETEYQQLQDLQSREYENDLAKQEAVVIYLEKLVPDMEEIMLEKALELKGDLFRERVAGLREHYSGQDQSLTVLDQAEEALKANLWLSAVSHVNSLK